MKLFSGIAFALLAAGALSAADLRVEETAEAITVTRGETPVLTYHKADVPPPAGVDPVYRRSGFIHPLRTPSGASVTGIHPEDHHHHIGLWHAWVKTKHGDDEPDFWNLGKKTGRVRYAKTLEIDQGTPDDPAAGFAVEQEQVAYKGKAKKETVVLRERFEVTVHDGDGANVVTYAVQQKNVSEESLVLPAYRYGGLLAYRAPHHWDQTNSDYLTSEGLDRTNSHQSRAKWVRMHGPVDKGIGALTVLIHPENRDFPQRLRTWPASANNGAIFFNVVPTQETAWEIKPGQSIAMRYRLVATDGKPKPAQIEKWWKAFAGTE